MLVKGDKVSDMQKICYIEQCLSLTILVKLADLMYSVNNKNR